MKKIIIFSVLILLLIHFQTTVMEQRIAQNISSTVATTDNLQAKIMSALEATSHYPKDKPATVAPLLEWKEDLNAVYYQLEVFAKLPDNLSDSEISSEHLFFTAQVYTHAYHIDLQKIAPEYIAKEPLFWRVRSMDIDGNPISKFSKPEILYSENKAPTMNSPLPHVQYNKENGTTLLYPVYSFVPNANATQFEIEVTDKKPENPNGIEPSVHRIFSQIVTGGELYDPDPRIGTYYWRVRGLDDNNNPVGVYCDAQEIRNEPADNWQFAILGDSISHGGGHLSFGPADWQYSYAYYLDFPTINLSFSGDTSETTLERFDRDVVPFHPQYLLIMTGTNSLRAGVPAEKVISDLKQIQLKCRQNNITPILLTLAPINPDNIKKVFDQGTSNSWQENFDEVNAFIRTQAHIDTAGELNSPAILPTEYAMDGLHGDVNAKQLYAKAINEQIGQFINK